ncbi:MAG: putative metal-binding motif-containing protein [Myxococcota bacterium]
MRTTTLGWVLWMVAAGCAGTDDPSDSGDESPGEDTIDQDDDGDLAATDCDDADPEVHAGAEEHCDGADEDCDGVIDDQPVDGETTFTDDDQDGFGGTELRVCPGVPLGPTVGGDCADDDPARFPGAPERCPESMPAAATTRPGSLGQSFCSACSEPTRWRALIAT